MKTYTPLRKAEIGKRKVDIMSDNKGKKKFISGISLLISKEVVQKQKIKI